MEGIEVSADTLYKKDNKADALEKFKRDHQGRTPRKVKNNNKVAFYSIVLGVAVFVAFVIYEVFKS